MKFSVPQEQFSKALSIVSRVVSTRATLPVLSGLYMELVGDELTIIGSNVETAYKKVLNVNGEDDGQFVVPARLLTDFVLTLSDGELHIETDEKSLKIKTGKIKSDFTGLPVEEYPTLSFSTQDVFYSLPTQETQDSMDRVCFAASSDEARAILTGVSIKAENDVVEMASTDGFRLSIEKFNSKTDKNFSVVIPAKIMLELGRVLRESSGNNAGNFKCALTREGTQIVFTLSDSLVLMSRILDGTFPPYNKIVPTSYATKVIFKFDELSKMVKTASLFARNASPVLKLTIDADGGVIRLSSATEQVGEYSAELTAPIEGSNNVVAFNTKYVLDYMSKVKSEEIEFEMNGPNQPGVFKIKEIPSFLHVIMPVRVDS
jgi:DNA polymerase III subunit beta